MKPIILKKETEEFIVGKLGELLISIGLQKIKQANL